MILFDSHDQAPHVSGLHRVLLPPRLESKTALLAFLKETLHLPAYFGGNWDALEECLGDPLVMGPGRTALVHHDLPMESEPDEQRVYLQIIGAAARESERFDVVFPHDYRDRVLASLAAD